ncbi:glucan biosynthesis protein D [soil metagenome]
MTYRLTRRDAVTGIAASILAASASMGSGRADESPLRLGPPQAFSFDALAAKAQALSRQSYAAAVVKAWDLLDKIDFEEQIDITYRPDHTILPGSATPIRLFHPHKFAKEPVKVNLVENDHAREILYGPDLFTFGPKAAIAKDLPADVGFAGFRILNANEVGDWLAFQGASYFRSSGELNQYGLSARGLAIDTGLSTPEEFPRFTEFWVEAQGSAVAVYALLEGPSVAGAYRILCRKDKVVTMDVDSRLFMRKPVNRLGIAPLTSMFWYSELNRAGAPDWRPEVHDSDGLSMWTGSGEKIWRPLTNPAVVMTNSFFDDFPKGFGLLQRDRRFADYEDDGVFYERRPSVWIEPLGDWGEGAVQLVEIPTDAEIHDNIAAYWVPKTPASGGQALSFGYRIHWIAHEPVRDDIGCVVDTRRGRGGRPAEVDKIGLVKYVIDFEGGDLAKYESGATVEPMISVSAGEVLNPYALRVNTTNKWRIVFDLKPPTGAIVDMRAYLRLRSGEALTETWLFQHLPGAT